MCAENKYVMMLNCWKECSQSLRIYFLASLLFSMAPCRYWRCYLLQPNRKNHHSFGAGSLALYNGDAGLPMNGLCLPPLSILHQLSRGGSSAFFVVFFGKRTCGEAFPEVDYYIPTLPSPIHHCVLRSPALCSGDAGPSMDCRCPRLHLFWQQTCGDGRLMVGQCVPTPPNLFLFFQGISCRRDCHLFIMVPLVRGRIIASHLWK